MKSNDKTLQALSRIKELEAEEPSEATCTELLALLAHRSNHVVGPATELVGEWELEEAIPPLEKAFYHFLENPTKTDPGCIAKRPIVETLTKLGCVNAELFLIGVRTTQLDPMWGKPEDTAAGLRGVSGRALLSIRHPEAMLIHADLVMDTKIETRRIAIDSLAELGSGDAELMLRTLANAPERPFNKDDPDSYSVLPDCLTALMKMNAERSLEFVTRFLYREPEVMESAALAIGESRHPEAFELLKVHYASIDEPNIATAILLPIALTRTDEAFGFLCSELQHGKVDQAKGTLEALELFAADSDRLDRIHQLAMARKENAISTHFYAVFSEN